MGKHHLPLPLTEIENLRGSSVAPNDFIKTGQDITGAFDKTGQLADESNGKNGIADGPGSKNELPDCSGSF